MAEVTIYHNPNCSKSRAVLAIIEESKRPYRVILSGRTVIARTVEGFVPPIKPASSCSYADRCAGL